MSLLMLSAGGVHVEAVVVADSVTRLPLPLASVFDRNNRFVGTSGRNGEILCVSPSDFPIYVRYIGYKEQMERNAARDTIFLMADVAELSEVVVEARQSKLLHVLAYVREYSTLSTYTDTVALFREKMVDFMLPGHGKARFVGWRVPRVLNSRSYYRFTNANGLDSVSDRSNHHFTWSDWVGILPPVKMPESLTKHEIASDTLYGKYSPSEIWTKNGDNLYVDVDVLADTVSRKWVPNLKSFFKDNVEFERFNLRLNYGGADGDSIMPLDLMRYSFNIESRGRGRTMFRFNRVDEPFFVATYTEVYVLDKEFITVKEAKEWDKRKFDASEIAIYEPEQAPPLQASVLNLIDRVNNYDRDQARVDIEPNRRMISRNVMRQNFNIAHRALSMLKELTGITLIKSRKRFNDNYKNFRKEQTQKNKRKNNQTSD